MFYVYLLRSKKDGSFYVGQTQNLYNRLRLHNAGLVKSTSRKLPWDLAGYERYYKRGESRWREYDLKHNYTKKKEFIRKYASP